MSDEQLEAAKAIVISRLRYNTRLLNLITDVQSGALLMSDEVARVIQKTLGDGEEPEESVFTDLKN